ncbi:MAG TPA: hypothetical protein VF147_00440 [Vicinamibacterales bacterium]
MIREIRGQIDKQRQARTSHDTIATSTVGLTLFSVLVVSVLRRLGLLSLGPLLLAGAAIGNIPFAFFAVAFVLPATVAHLAVGTMSEHLLPLSALVAGTLRAVLIGSSIGVMSAALFWVVAIRGSGDAATPAVVG